MFLKEIIYNLEGNNLQIRMNALEEKFGDYEGKIIVNQNEDRYVIPFLLHFTEGAISVSQENGKLNFEIFHPESWSFAKISVTNSKDGSTDTRYHFYNSWPNSFNECL
jgi:minor extracellular serine protease Vpr